MELVLYVLITVIFYCVLYFVIKAAVRNGIMEARRDFPAGAASDGIAKRTCPSCAGRHDCDWPKCPFCGHVY